MADRWRGLLDELDGYPEDEVTELLARIAGATNPVSAGDVDLVEQVLGVTRVVLRARRRRRSWNGPVGLELVAELERVE